MKEIEVKILEIDVTAVRKKLKALGAKKTFDGNMRTTIFDTPNEQLKKKGLFLRLRQEGNNVHFCFKGKKESSKKFKVREEIELNVSSMKDMTIILSQLGFVKKYEYSKHREQYKLGKTSFDIDTYKKIPTFLEIEAPTEEEVERAVKLIGYSMKDTTNASASELFEKYE
jgi:adenylate cyclase class 2